MYRNAWPVVHFMVYMFLLFLQSLFELGGYKPTCLLRKNLTFITVDSPIFLFKFTLMGFWGFGVFLLLTLSLRDSSK